MKAGRKFLLTILGLVTLVAIIPLMKWAMGGVLPEGFAIPWLAALVGLLTQYSVSNAAITRKYAGVQEAQSDQTMGVVG